MSKAVELVKDGLSSAVRKTKGALKGDLGDIASVVSLGASDLVTQPIKAAGKKIIPQMPEMPDIELPDPAGATPGTVAKKAASVDIGATEGARRQSGSAKGSRKLRVPLGGLGR